MIPHAEVIKKYPQLVYQITWTPEALQTYIQILNYLEQNWTEREMKTFAKNVEDKIELIKTFSELAAC